MGYKIKVSVAVLSFSFSTLVYAQALDPSLMQVQAPEAPIAPLTNEDVAARAGGVSRLHFEATVLLMPSADSRKELSKSEIPSLSKQDTLLRSLESANPKFAYQVENEIIQTFQTKPDQPFHLSKADQKVTIAVLKAMTAENVRPSGDATPLFSNGCLAQVLDKLRATHSSGLEKNVIKTLERYAMLLGDADPSRAKLSEAARGATSHWFFRSAQSQNHDADDIVGILECKSTPISIVVKANHPAVTPPALVDGSETAPAAQ